MASLFSHYSTRFTPVTSLINSNLKNSTFMNTPKWEHLKIQKGRIYLSNTKTGKFSKKYSQAKMQQTLCLMCCGFGLKNLALFCINWLNCKEHMTVQMQNRRLTIVAKVLGVNTAMTYFSTKTCSTSCTQHWSTQAVPSIHPNQAIHSSSLYAQ